MKECPVCGCKYDSPACPECGTVIDTIQTSNLSSLNGGYTTTDQLNRVTKELGLDGNINNAFRHSFEPIDNKKTLRVVLGDIVLGLLVTIVIMLLLLWFLWN